MLAGLFLVKNCVDYCHCSKKKERYREDQREGGTEGSIPFEEY